VDFKRNRVGFLPRRGERTQPGVLNPGWLLFEKMRPEKWRQEIVAKGIDLLTRSYRAALVPLTRHIVLVLVVVLVLERVFR
jgi:hypothetical protein